MRRRILWPDSTQPWAKETKLFVVCKLATVGTSPWMVLLKTDSRVDDLRCEPRFQELLRRMNFPA
jgi:hypothetical protein